MQIKSITGLLILVAASLSPGASPQDPATNVEGIPALLDKAERLGMSVPDLPQACLEIEKIAGSGGDRVKPEWTHRLQILQSRAAIAEALHRGLKDAVGSAMEFPVLPGKREKATVLEVRKNAVEIQQGGAKVILSFSDLDPEWTVAT